ncbi:Histatin-1 [Manis javanica]|nr:Histatin-1 [Manis javanica]
MLWKIHCGNDSLILGKRTLPDMKIFIFAFIMALMVIMASADAFDGVNYFPNPPGSQYSSFATYRHDDRGLARSPTCSLSPDESLLENSLTNLLTSF